MEVSIDNNANSRTLLLRDEVTAGRFGKSSDSTLILHENALKAKT